MIQRNRIIPGWSKASSIVVPSGPFRDNGPGRAYAPTDSNMDLWEEIFRDFGLEPVTLEPHFQNFVGIHTGDGTHTHIHQDSAPKGFMHVRCNVMLEKPPVGGDTVVSGQVLPLQRGDAWLIFASKEFHGSTPIKGGRRVIFSFGALVKD